MDRGVATMSRPHSPAAGVACPHLDALADHVSAFAEVMTGRRGPPLNAWIIAVDADDQSDPHSFTAVIKNDHDALITGLTLPHSSRAVEGHVNHMLEGRCTVARSSAYSADTSYSPPDDRGPNGSISIRKGGPDSDRVFTRNRQTRYGSPLSVVHGVPAAPAPGRLQHDDVTRLARGPPVVP
jgi:hypothetical protein